MSYHLERAGYHQREAKRWESLITQATGADMRKDAKPESASVKGSKAPEENTKKAPSKTRFVENAILTSGILGVTAPEIRKQARAAAMHVATNFPYRQASRIIDKGKVWKDDKTGRYFHTSFVPQPKDPGSPQEISH